MTCTNTYYPGKDNFAADRELAAQPTAVYPPIAQMIWDNRQFLARAVGWVARQGISQFIDLGPGLPTSPSTHEAARAVTSGTTVAYVDFDPLVVSHLDALVANGQDGIVVMAADVRDRDAVLSAPDLVGHIDLSQPACLVMGAVLHFLDAVAAAELAASYTQLLAPGSYVVITVGRGDGEVADRFFGMYRAAARMHSHSLDQFATFFEGLEMVPPGLLLAEQWQPDLRHVRPVPKRPGEVLVGVGKVPGRLLHGVLCRGAGSRTGIKHPVRQTGVPSTGLVLRTQLYLFPGTAPEVVGQGDIHFSRRQIPSRRQRLHACTLTPHERAAPPYPRAGRSALDRLVMRLWAAERRGFATAPNGGSRARCLWSSCRAA